MVDITKLATFVQSSPFPAWLATSKGDCVYANPALERLTGLDSDQINQADWPSFLLEEDRAAATASCQRSLAIGAPYRARVRMRGFDGVPATVELIAFGQQVVDGRELWLFAGLPVDSATQQQPQFEAQLQTTLNVIPAYTWYAAPSGALTFVNERTGDYLGLPKDHPLRFGIDIGGEWDAHIPLLHPDDQEESRRVWATCLRTGSAGEFSQRVPNAEGAYRWFLSRAEPLRASDGTLLYWIGVNLDIEDRKRAEEELRRREAYLAEAQGLSQTGSFGWRPDSGEIVWSDETYRIFEYDRALKPTIDLLVERVHPEDRADFQKVIDRASAGGTDFDHAYRLLLPDGRVKYIHAIAHALQDASGNHEFVGAATDVTSIKRAEEELRTSEAYLVEAQSLTHMGSWAWQVPGRDALHLSDEWYRIYGFDPKEGMPAWEQRLQRVHPEDREKWQATIEQAIRERSDYDVEFRIVLPDGTLKWVHTVGHPVLSAARELVEFVGSSMEITERKQAEHRIREQEAELRQILDLSPQHIFVFGPDSRPLYANQVALEYFGVDIYQLLGEARTNFLHPDDREWYLSERKKRFLEGAPHEIEVRLLRHDGKFRWFLVRLNPLKDERGHITRWYGTGTDIEDRKRAEDKIREQETELRQMLDLTPQLVAVFGPRRERLYTNRMALDYFGLSLDEWLQSSTGSDIHPDDVERLKAAWDHSLSTGSPFELELRVRKADGSYRWVSGSVQPPVQRQGKYLSLVRCGYRHRRSQAG